MSACRTLALLFAVGMVMYFAARLLTPFCERYVIPATVRLVMRLTR